MSLNPIAGAQPIQSAPVGTATNKPQVPSKTQGAADTQDTVHLSSTAQAQLSTIKAAAQEAAETPATTAREAQSGDPQARRLLAKEAAAAKAVKGE